MSWHLRYLLRPLVTSIVLFLMVSGFNGCGNGKSFELARNGESSYAIILSTDASTSESHAAKELKHFVKMATGAELTIYSENDDRAEESNRIIIGRNKVAKKLLSSGPPVKWDKLKEHGEGFVIRTVQNNGSKDIVIAGADQRGTMFGVYTFLDTLGFRWYTNRYTWFKTPNKTVVLDYNKGSIILSVPPLNIVETPKFDYRYPYISEATDKDWAARNRTNAVLDDTRGGSVSIQCGHTFERLIPPSLFKEHPEFFPLIGGKRVTGYVQRCLTAPGIVELTAENMIEWMDNAPDQTYFSLGQNDGSNICECPECTKIAEAEGSQAGLYHNFVNKVAEIVENKHPDKYIITFAYAFTEKPPKTVKPRHNVYIQLAPIGICVAHPFTECIEEKSKELRKTLTEWAKKTDRISVWHYCTNFRNLLMPFPDFKEFMADIKTYHQNGVRGIFFQGSNHGPGGGDADMRAWVMAEMLWNPYLDGYALVDEYLHGVFGDAYEPMRAYFDLIHAQVADPEDHLTIFKAVTTELWPKSVVASMDSIHKVALNLVKDEEAATYYVKKNHMAVKFVDYVLNTGRLEVVDGKYRPVGNKMTLQDHTEFSEYIKQFDVRELREESRDAKFLRILRQRVETHDVVTIENADIQVDVVPKLGGRIVRLIHKNTGVNIVNTLDSTENFYPIRGGYGESTAWTWGCTGFANPYDAKVKGRTMTLTAKTSRGFLFKRTLSLPARGAKINFTSSIINENNNPTIYKLVCRIFLKASPKNLTLEIRKKNGQYVTADNNLLEIRRLDSDNKPQGVWRFVNIEGGLTVENRFKNNQVYYVQHSYSDEDKFALVELHSEEREVRPNGKIVIEHQWEIKE